MRLVILFFLLSTVHSSVAQISLKETLLKDFAASRNRPYSYSLHPYWYARDTTSIVARDTTTFHNKPAYYLGVSGVCKFLNWSFTSKHTISQSAYFPFVGHGYSVVALNGSGKYRFKVKEAFGKTYLKLTNNRLQVIWFEVYRSQEYDSRNIAYPVMTLVRLKNKPD